MNVRSAPRDLHLLIATLIIVGTALGSTPSPASTPALMNYQGYLTDATGTPRHGSFPMAFAMYTDSIGGTLRWSESYEAVQVTSGLFTVLLGGSVPLPIGTLFTGEMLWLQTTVSDTALAPRRPIVTVPYAFRSGEAALADSAASAPAPPGAVIYTRWGRTSCPAGAELVYQGFAAGSNFQHTGSGAGTLCLSQSPTWDLFNDGDQNGALVYGVEYQTASGGVASLVGLNNREAPCAVCLRDAKAVLMIPGTQVCPEGWNVEYPGYLMSSYFTQNRQQWVCVDRAPEGTGSSAAQTGHAWYPTEAECGALPCGPYIQNREVTCVVCTRP